MTTLNQAAAAYLTSRGLDLDLAAKRGLYSDSSNAGEGDDSERANLIAIPYFQGDRRVNVKFRKLGKLKPGEAPWLSLKGGELVFWNRDAINDPGLAKEPLIITEGEWDALAALQAGFLRVISVPNGAPDKEDTKEHTYIDEAFDDLERVDQIIIATDNDKAGIALRKDLLKRLGRARCSIVSYPQGCKDLGDALRIYGKDNPARGIKAVRLAIEQAKLVKMDGLFSFDELPDEDEEVDVFNPKSFGAGLESHIGLRRGDLSFWTGSPGGGKTTLLRAISWAAAIERGWKTSAAFFEDKPKRDTVRSLKRLYGNGWPVGEREKEAEQWIREHYHFIMQLDRRKSVTIGWFLDQADAAVRRHGVDLIIADPWSQFKLSVSREQDKLDAILEGILSLKAFAETMDVHVAVIAHPRKPEEWGGTTKMPDGYAISGSHHFRDRCDLGVSVQNAEGVDYVTNVRVWKSRDREEQGNIGDFSMHLSKDSKRFSPIAPEDAEAMRRRAEKKVVQLSDRRHSRADLD